MTETTTKTRRLVSLGMLCALAYLVMLVGRIPLVIFLKYDPKDVIIVIGGFLFGPSASLVISLVVAVIELSVSDTGIIGCIMNAVSSCAFACTAAWVYSRNRTLKGAVTGLIAGVLTVTAVMLAWNYFLTPIYMGYPRETVAAMLLPIFLPFNLIKGSINAAITMLLYKPVVGALRAAKLAPAADLGSVDLGSAGMMTSRTVVLGAAVVIAICVAACIILW
ncbi:MAG: ECF transporter S component [Clostridia bacterium]|nr:ECF transporter S component [Clostridia bacterium]